MLLLAEHYDPAYRRSSQANYVQLAQAPRVRIGSADEPAFDSAAATLLLGVQAGENANVLHGATP